MALGLVPLNGALDPSPQHSYLFFSQRGEEVFLILMKEMHELNDFFVHQSRGEKEAVANARNLFILPAANDYERDDEEELGSAIEAFECGQFDSIEVPLADMLLPTIAHVALYAFLIRAMQLLNRELCPEDHDDHSKCSGTDELAQLAGKLSDISKRELNIFERRRAQLNDLRRLRNSFMHGDWAKAQKLGCSLSVRSSFELVRDVLYSLELVLHSPLEALSRGALDISGFLPRQDQN